MLFFCLSRVGQASGFFILFKRVPTKTFPIPHLEFPKSFNIPLQLSPSSQKSFNAPSQTHHVTSATFTTAAARFNWNCDNLFFIPDTTNRNASTSRFTCPHKFKIPSLFPMTTSHAFFVFLFLFALFHGHSSMIPTSNNDDYP